MSLQDLEAVLEIERSTFSFPWPKNSFYREIINNDYAYYFAARLKGENKVIGYGGIWVLFDEAHITTLAVHSLHRQAGAGSILLSHLLEEALARGARQVFLEVRDSNLAARTLYKKYDFEIIGRRKNYYYHEDALLMVRKFTD
ncbi:MAG: ribosomal protein S18-alanine N-acetyltransferase [Firmicutes bacterium]|nr:ribosomal protein S18-alanine N-acetyltransferase [Bacillota bacterium]